MLRTYTNKILPKCGWDTVNFAAESLEDLNTVEIVAYIENRNVSLAPLPFLGLPICKI